MHHHLLLCLFFFSACNLSDSQPPQIVRDTVVVNNTVIINHNTQQNIIVQGQPDLPADLPAAQPNHNETPPTATPTQPSITKENLSQRQIIRKCDGLTNNSSVDESGVIWVKICVDASGKVGEATCVSKSETGEISTITNRKLKDLALQCARQYRYASGSGTACGTIPIYFNYE